MGKISRALEKSGIDTNGEDRPAAEVSQETEAAAPRRKKKKQGPVPRKNENGNNLQTGRWDERLSLATSFSLEAVEPFRVLRSRILYPDDDSRTFRTILVVSTVPREGKSFVSANLAIALAQGVDQRCLLVDCDLRRPTLARLFGLSGDRGLADYLLKGSDLAGLIQKTSVDKLTLLASGRPPINPAELLGSTKMHGLVRELAERYDDRLIIFDSPPIMAASETTVLSQKVDGVVLVIRHGVSSRNQIQKVVELIGKDQIIGVVFNGYESHYLEDRMLGQHSYYGSYYSEEEKAEKV